VACLVEAGRAGLFWGASLTSPAGDVRSFRERAAGDDRGGYGGGKASVEGNVGDQRRDFPARDSVVTGTQLSRKLFGPVESYYGAARCRAAVPRAEGRPTQTSLYRGLLISSVSCGVNTCASSHSEAAMRRSMELQSRKGPPHLPA